MKLSYDLQVGALSRSRGSVGRDTEEVRVPILFGQVFHYDDAVVDALNTAGLVFLAAYVVSVVWLVLALAVTSRKA